MVPDVLVTDPRSYRQLVVVLDQRLVFFLSAHFFCCCLWSRFPPRLPLSAYVFAPYPNQATDPKREAQSS